MLAVVADVRREWRGGAKVFLTGFSAGGHLTWLLAFAHPEALAAVAAACANYAGRGAATLPPAPGRERPPIKAFQGDADRLLPAFTEQWEAARRAAEAHGYAGLSRELVRGAGHAPLASPVLAFFSTLLR